MKSCKCCGKLHKPDADTYDAEKRQCVDRLGCMERALGPTSAKAEALRLAKANP